MNVQELFKKVPFDDFFNVFCRNEGSVLDVLTDSSLSSSERDEKMYRLRQNVLTSYTNMQHHPVRSSNKILFVMPVLEETSSYFDAFYVEKEDLMNDSGDCNYDKYSFDLESVDNILGYNVSKATLHFFDDDATVAYAIFDEMSFHGLPCLESTEERKTEVLETLMDSVAEIESGDLKEYPTADDVFKELGYTDERTQAQKDFDMEIMVTSSEYFKSRFKSLTKLEVAMMQD